MSGAISNAAGGLKTLMEAVTGLTVHDSPPDAVTRFPAVVISLEAVQFDPTLSGDDMELVFGLTVLVRGGVIAEAWDALETLLAPTGATTSIRGAIGADPTLGGTVDTCLRAASRRGAGLLRSDAIGYA